MPLSFWVQRFGYGIRVRVWQSGVSLPFTIVEPRYGYYYVRYDDGRTGYIGQESSVLYELYRGLPPSLCPKEVGGVVQFREERSVRNAEVVGSTPITSTWKDWFHSLISWMAK